MDLLVGPAGAGKTTTMRALRAAWIAEHGRGSVIGLAPSATAAQALGDDLGVACDNTAKWLHEYDHGRTDLRAGQLVIIDEATLAGTATLDRISGIAEAAGAKVLLVGDPYQLQSVEAGGAFALLVDRRTDAPELTDIHRFVHEWEKHASLALRRGEVEVISTYVRQKRIHEGLTDDMLDRAYEAWRADCRAGKASILVTESSQAVRTLNERARAERLLAAGAVDGREVLLADGNRASIGDHIITRRNDRALRTSRGGWVKNGDRWRVVDIRRDGSMLIDRLDPRYEGKAVLPAEYVAEHVDLGYAVTAHRAQGITVDTSHVVVTPSTTRENLYVSMSSRPGLEHRLRRPRPARRQPLDTRARRRHGPHRALRRAQPQRRQHVRTPDDGGRVRHPWRHRPTRRRARDHRRRCSTPSFRGTPSPLRPHPRTARSGRSVRARSARSSRPFEGRRPSTTILRSWFPAPWPSTRWTMPTTSRQSSGTGSSRPPPPRPATADFPHA